ncbi:MAG TPA: hypothetical protein VH575_09470 [Gemmataceae bacterium]|jgi:hypothetical protein
MILAPKAGDLPYNGDGDPSSAQTERRGHAGPVRGLLGGKDLTGRFLHASHVKSPSGLWTSRDHFVRVEPCFHLIARKLVNLLKQAAHPPRCRN